jgi:hypothetical protein
MGHNRHMSAPLSGQFDHKASFTKFPYGGGWIDGSYKEPKEGLQSCCGHKIKNEDFGKWSLTKGSEDLGTFKSSAAAKAHIKELHERD